MSPNNDPSARRTGRRTSGSPPSKSKDSGIPTPARVGDKVTVGSDEKRSVVIPFTSWRPGAAIEAAVRHETVTVTLPLVGPVTLPSGPHMAWYAGVATLAVLEIVEWPVAILMATAKALADSRHHRLLSEFGEALEEGA